VHAFPDHALAKEDIFRGSYLMRNMDVRVGTQQISLLHHDGPRTAVLLIHGNSSCKEVFMNQVDALASAGFAIVAPDLPGHGRSDDAKKPRTIYSFPGYARILADLMNNLGIVRYHIVGWSLGGHVGLELWYRFSAVKSLLITGTPPIPLSARGASRGFVTSPLMDLAGKRTFDRSEIEAYGGAMLGQALDHRKRVARTIARTDGRARYWMLRNGLAGRGINQAMAVQKCTRPLAIIQGRVDPFVNIDYLRGLTYGNLWSRNLVLLDAGHAPHWTKPRLFNHLMLSFLKHAD
jgi:pimeloyl-ACP methyl ester carboxylesterase